MAKITKIDSKNQLQRAKKYMEKGNYRTASIYLHKIINTPHLYKKKKLLSKVLDELIVSYSFDTFMQIKAITKKLSYFPNDKLALSHLIIALINMGDHMKAKKYLDKVDSESLEQAFFARFPDKEIDLQGKTMKKFIEDMVDFVEESLDELNLKSPSRIKATVEPNRSKEATKKTEFIIHKNKEKQLTKQEEKIKEMVKAFNSSDYSELLKIYNEADLTGVSKEKLLDVYKMTLFAMLADIKISDAFLIMNKIEELDENSIEHALMKLVLLADNNEIEKFNSEYERYKKLGFYKLFDKQQLFVAFADMQEFSKLTEIIELREKEGELWTDNDSLLLKGIAYYNSGNKQKGMAFLIKANQYFGVLSKAYVLVKMVDMECIEFVNELPTKSLNHKRIISVVERFFNRLTSFDKEEFMKQLTCHLEQATAYILAAYSSGFYKFENCVRFMDYLFNPDYVVEKKEKEKENIANYITNSILTSIDIPPKIKVKFLLFAMLRGRKKFYIFSRQNYYETKLPELPQMGQFVKKAVYKAKAIASLSGGSNAKRVNKAILEFLANYKMLGLNLKCVDIMARVILEKYMGAPKLCSELQVDPMRYKEVLTLFGFSI